jgi:autotransporter passenger strand-loop-strand repeat protein
VVESGGIARGTAIRGGTEFVLLGGTASGTTISSGGLEDVLSGGITSNATISGGKLELANGASAGSGAITFAGSGGVLKIDGTTMPTNVISGFAPGDTIDLAAVTFSSGGGVVVTSGNVLKVKEGGVTYNLQLNPSQNFSEDAFALSSDGTGGTDVTVSVPSGAETTEAPHLTVSSSLSVSPGTSIPMGISATPVDSDDTVSITIKGVPSFETISAGPGETVTSSTHQGLTTYTITSITPGASITDLTLNSVFKGKGSPVNNFTVTTSNSTSGETATSPSKTVAVTDPPINAVALLNQYAAAFPDQNGVLNTNPLSQVVMNQEQFLAHPHHG